MHAYDGGASKYSIGMVLGVPSRGPISLRWMMHMGKLVPNNMPMGFEWKYAYTIGKAIDVARQEIVEKAMLEKSKYILFIDDDVFVPLNTIVKLVNHNKDVVMGLYWGKAEPCFPVIFEPESDIGAGPWLEYPREALTRVSGGGLGCCLIKTDVFRKLRDEGEDAFFKIDWIRTKADGQKSKVSVGEDHYFYDLCGKHGIEVYCDTSVRCDHYDTIKDKFYPTEDVIEAENKIIDKKQPQSNSKSIDTTSSQANINPLKVEKVVHNPTQKSPVSELTAQNSQINNVVTEKLNLGCGMDYREGWMNVDKQKNVKADLYLDFDMQPLPFDDNRFDEVIMYDVLEHIQDPFWLMGEIYRVCKHGAKVDIACPYPTSDYQACDPTHVKAYNEITFSFFSKKAYEKDKGTARSQLGIDFDFDIDQMILSPNADYKNYSPEALRECKKKYLNVIDKIRCIMKVNKN